jgi:hypothetical protein
MLTSAFQIGGGNTGTVNIAVTGSSQSIQCVGTQVGDNSYLVTNVGGNTVFIAFGGSGVTASLTTSCPVLPNSAQTFSAGPSAYVAAIAASSGNTLYITPGSGL